jgi:predicted ATPase
VELDARQDDKQEIRVSIDGNRITFHKFVSEDGRQYRPAYVFGYYSGPSNRLEQHFEKHQQLFYEDLLANKPRPLRRLFYARPVHSQFVLLSFFGDPARRRQKFLKEFLGIEALDSVLFIIREPPWRQARPAPQVRQEGDPRFWYARGTVKGFLGRLYQTALAPLRLNLRTAIEFRKFKRLQHLYLFIRDNDDLARLAKDYESRAEFFKTLESTYISKLLAEVRIRVRIRNVDGSLTFRELSEGEQQLITVLGLLEFTKEHESLFLLDEPDTHLNPSWSMQYLELLKRVVKDSDRSHIIMATHDPLVLSDLLRSQVQVLRNDRKGRHITAEKPEDDPRGMGVAGILTSDMFGLRTTVGLKTQRQLDEKRTLVAKKKLSKQEKLRLKELNEELAGLGFATSFRDPLYERFTKALLADFNQELFEKPVLTKSEQAHQQKIVDTIVAKLK